MKLQDIYDQLAYGEFSNISWGHDLDAPEGGMPEEAFKKLVPTVQLGLTELHKRFLLREDEVTIPLVAEKSTYILLRKVDAPESFADNLNKIERVYGTVGGKSYEIPLNKRDNAASIRTSGFQTLIVPTDIKAAPWLKETTELRIVYRADHPKISTAVAGSAPLAVTIDLPGTYLEALLMYMASRVSNPKGASEGFHEGNNYAAKFEAACALLNSLNYAIDEDAEDFSVVSNDWP